MITLIIAIELALALLYYHFNKKLKKLIGTGRMTDIYATANYKKIIEAGIVLIPIVSLLTTGYL